jgi:hypothetical protein
MQPPTADASLIVEAALSAIGLITVATFVTVWKLRDAVRDLTAVVTDPRTGLAVAVDRMAATVQAVDRRVQSLELWRESQHEGASE